MGVMRTAWPRRMSFWCGESSGRKDETTAWAHLTLTCSLGSWQRGICSGRDADRPSSKPQVARSILSEEGMASALEGKLVISICAGVTLAQLRSWVPESTTVVRAMPNTPCKIREGMTVVTPLSNAMHRALVLAIFTSCGRCRFLDEKHFDACTALAGSGPAFVALVLEAMADGGVMMGLPRVEALELAAQSTSFSPYKQSVGRCSCQLCKVRDVWLSLADYTLLSSKTV